MTTLKDRATNVVNGPGWAAAPHTEPHHVAAPRPDHAPAAVRTTRSVHEPGPVPRGWGSHDERRMMLLGLAAFVALALYAVVFILLGQSL